MCLQSITFFFKAWFAVVAIIQFLSNTYGQMGSNLKITYYSLKSI